MFKRKTKIETEEEKEEKEAQKVFEKGMVKVADIIAPAALDINFDYLRIGDRFCKTIFVYGYPRYIYTNWLSPVINFDATFDISMFIYPVESRKVMENLRKRVAQMESSIAIDQERGQVRDPGMEAALEDAEEIRDKLQRGEERFFQFALYFTFYAESKEELDNLSKKIESMLAAKLVYTKPTLLQVEQGFNSTLPINNDEVFITRNMDTSSLSTTFPFTSSELTTNEGILYGINRHNNTLIIFDRFNLENANEVVFAKAGAGKSYAVKLEALRYMMIGTDVIVIDPEEEYKMLCEAVGGSYLNVSLNSNKRINPFDLPKVVDVEEESGGNALRSNIIILLGLMNLMLGRLTPEEDALMDKALMETYSLKDITEDPKTWGNPAPTMEDLYKVLQNMEGAESLAQRLEKYVIGTASGIFNKPTNIDLDNQFIVFSIRDLEDQLRPIAMYIIIDYIWNRIKSELKRRILVIDEAWHLMQYEDSARFVFGLAKRARKYYLGLTTITQDVDDFLGSKWGKAIVTNSSIQLLLKQSPAAIDYITDVFKLTEGEKYLLLECEVGDGIFFAGMNHVAIHIMASYAEDQLITTNPKELLEIKAAKADYGKNFEPETPQENQSQMSQESSPKAEVPQTETQEKPEEAVEEKEDLEEKINQKSLMDKSQESSQISENGKILETSQENQIKSQTTQSELPQKNIPIESNTGNNPKENIDQGQDTNII